MDQFSHHLVRSRHLIRDVRATCEHLAPCTARHVIALVFQPCRGSTDGQLIHGEHMCHHRGAMRGEVCEEIELSKVLKIRRSRHDITSEQLAARGVKIR